MATIFQMESRPGKKGSGDIQRGEREASSPKGSCPHLAVMEGLGADGQAAQLDGLLEPAGDLQALQLVIGVPGQLVGTQGLALLGQSEECVPADDGVKESKHHTGPKSWHCLFLE